MAMHPKCKHASTISPNGISELSLHAFDVFFCEKDIGQECTTKKGQHHRMQREFFNFEPVWFCGRNQMKNSTKKFFDNFGPNKMPKIKAWVLVHFFAKRQIDRWDVNCAAKHMRAACVLNIHQDFFLFLRRVFLTALPSNDGKSST